MGRRKLPENEKRQLHSLRLDPSVREKIEAVAKESGSSFAATAEAYLKAGLSIMSHPMMSRELLEIFIAIMDEMAEVHALNHNKRWTIDLKTWAACKLIFAKGPFARRNPDNWKTDPVIDALWKEVSEARQSKTETVNLLGKLGISVHAAKQTERFTRRGLFGTNNAMIGVDNRAQERKQIEAIDDPVLRGQCLAIFSLLEQMDEVEDRALKAWFQEVKLYLDREAEGEELYRQWRQEVVRRDMASGNIPAFEDIV